MKPFKSEVEMASVVIEWLKSQEWKVYQEVQPHSYSSIADIVAERSGICWVIETKLAFSLDLIGQACGWLHRAHFVSICAPTKSIGFASIICAKFGIGVLKAYPSNGYHDAGINEIQPPRFFRVRRIETLLKYCTEEHQTFAQAGNANGDRLTPWKQTCRSVARIACSSPGITLKAMLTQLDHHYASDATARTCLAAWGQAGRIKGIEMRKEGKNLTVWPIQSSV